MFESSLQVSTINEYLMRTYNIEIFYPTPDEEYLLEIPDEKLMQIGLIYGGLIQEENLFGRIVEQSYQKSLIHQYGPNLTKLIKEHPTLIKAQESFLFDFLGVAVKPFSPNANYAPSKRAICVFALLNIINAHFPKLHNYLKIKLPCVANPDDYPSIINAVRIDNSELILHIKLLLEKI